MSLVGFKAQNNTQQVKKRGAKPEVDNLATPPEVFDPLNERFGFTVDACALPHNAKLPRYWSPEQDGLTQTWTNERVWCNPPYSDIGPWCQKAWGGEEGMDRPQLAVLLVPANRCEQSWWQRFVEPYRDRGPLWRMSDMSLSVEFLPGRLRFIKHGHDRIEPNQRPPFGCALLIFKGRGA